MFYRVQRKSEKIYFIEKLDKEEIYGLNKKDYMEIVDDVISSTVDTHMADGYIVWFNTIDSVIGTDVGKYRDIPTTDVKKVKALKSAREDLESKVTEVEMIDYISYIDANNILNSNGFFVTDKNREEVYLDILEAGDDLIIDALEEFLTLKDKLTVIKSAKRVYDDLEEKIKQSTEDEVEDLHS